MLHLCQMAKGNNDIISLMVKTFFYFKVQTCPVLFNSHDRGKSVSIKFCGTKFLFLYVHVIE